MPCFLVIQFWGCGTGVPIRRSCSGYWARTERDAQLGPLLAGFLKILPVFFLVLPGVIAYVLFQSNRHRQQSDVACSYQRTGSHWLKRVHIGRRSGCPAERRVGGVEQLGNPGGSGHRKAASARTSDRGLVQIGRISSTVVMILRCFGPFKADDSPASLKP